MTELPMKDRRPTLARFVQPRRGMRARAIAAVGVLVAHACDKEPRPSPDLERVAADADVVIAAEVVQLRLYSELRKIDFTGVDPALAGPTIVDATLGGLMSALAEPACLTRETDGATYLELRFADCQHPSTGRLDGAIRLEFTAVAGQCSGVACVVAVDYALAVTDLELHSSTITRSQVTLRASTDPTQPVIYASDAELPADGRVLEARTEASWGDDGACVTADFGIELTAPEHAAAIGGRGVRSCMGCPEAGEVQLSWGAGEAVAWEYTGEGEIAVTGPRGLDVSLSTLCAAL